MYTSDQFVNLPDQQLVFVSHVDIICVSQGVIITSYWIFSELFLASGQGRQAFKTAKWDLSHTAAGALVKWWQIHLVALRYCTPLCLGHLDCNDTL